MIFQNSESINNLLRRHIYEIIYKQVLGTTCGAPDSCLDDCTDTNGKGDVSYYHKITIV